MSDVDVAASNADVNPAVVETPNPIVTEAEPAKVEAANKAAAEKAEAEKTDKAEPIKKAPTNREALEAAVKKVAAKETETVKDGKPEPKAEADPKGAKVEAKPDAKPEVKATPVKDPATGQFVSPKATVEPAKPVTESKYPDAPTRFTNEAKAAWRDAPENVRAEVHRAVGELERGFEKHREKAAAYDKIAPFDELAKKTGTTLDAAMSRYVQMDQLLQRDFMGGLEKLCANRGVSLRDVAAQVMGQKPDQVAGKQDRTIAELRNTVQQLQQQIGGVTKTIEQQKMDGVFAQIESFKSQQGHDRYDELEPDIALFLQSGKAKTLIEAYELAERLNPAPASPPQRVVAAPDLSAQTDKGSKSLTGAPGPGSDPSRRAPAPNNREALKRAFAHARA